MSDDDITARIRPPFAKRNAMTTATKLINAAADSFDALDKVVSDTAVSAALSGAAAVLRGVAALLVDRTPEEAVAVLEMLRDHGAQPITKSELDAQTQATLDKARAKP